MDWLNVYGLIFVIFMLVPNVVYALRNKESENKCKNKMINITEQIGRFGSMFFMVFHIEIWDYDFVSRKLFVIWLVFLTIFIVGYWIAWALYFIRAKIQYALALAIIPSIAFIGSGLLMRNYWLLVCGILFAIGHIYITYYNHKGLEK